MSCELVVEDYRCDKDGYFDLDSLKPYSSVWVSTRRDARTKTLQPEEDTDSKKNVTSSRACNDLHSLLETNDPESPVDEINQVNSRALSQHLSSTKSDHFPLNSYKLFEKGGEGFSLRKISDKIIGSMCKSDSKGDDYSSSGNSSDSIAKEKSLDLNNPSTQELVQEEEVSGSNQELIDTEKLSDMKFQKSSDELVSEKLTRENSRSSHLGGGDPQEDNKPKLLFDNGKLISEINITTIKVKDQLGREFPITVKYAWETDPNEVIKASENTFYSSPAFLKIIENLSSIGIKLNKTPVEPPKTNTQSWQDKTKSQSNIGPRNRRNESWNVEEKENESSYNLNKGDGPLRKGLGNQQNAKNSFLRSKVSLAGPHHDKKTTETVHNEKKDVKPIESGLRDGSKFNMIEKKGNIDRKTRAPIKKKLPGVDDYKVPGALARPATFNKGGIVPKPPATRPPSAPTREQKPPHRIGVQDSGDRLTQSFNKRGPFGASKFQSPPTDPNSKFWK